MNRGKKRKFENYKFAATRTLEINDFFNDMMPLPIISMIFGYDHEFQGECIRIFGDKMFDYPVGLATFANELFVLDRKQIQVFDSTGQLKRQFGLQFFKTRNIWPLGIAVCFHFVLVTSKEKVCKFNRLTGSEEGFIEDYEFKSAFGIAIDQTRNFIYVTDSMKAEVPVFLLNDKKQIKLHHKLSTTGSRVFEKATFRGIAVSPFTFQLPRGIAVDPLDHKVYVVNQAYFGTGRILVFNEDGLLIDTIKHLFEKPTFVVKAHDNHIIANDLVGGPVDRSRNKYRIAVQPINEFQIINTNAVVENKFTYPALPGIHLSPPFGAVFFQNLLFVGDLDYNSIRIYT